MGFICNYANKRVLIGFFREWRENCQPYSVNDQIEANIMHHVKARLCSSPAILTLAILSLATACNDSTPQSEAQSKAESEAATMTAIKQANAGKSAATQAGVPKQNRGLVKEVEMAGGYTYARVDVGGDEFWLATTMTVLHQGEEVAWKDYAMMKHFKSKALNREFDQLLFVDRLFTAATELATPRRGIVAESMSAAGYSFIRVEENGSSIWLAAPETTLEVGQTIEWSGGGEMRNFTSRSLNRVFDQIIFVDRVQIS